MKKTVTTLLLLFIPFICNVTLGQSLGLEKRVSKKNIYITLKGGLADMGMQYSGEKPNGNKTESFSFFNHSALYNAFLNDTISMKDVANGVTSCYLGGIGAERTLPHFSYGLEVYLSGIKATTTPKKVEKKPEQEPNPASNKVSEMTVDPDQMIATKDSTIMVHFRVPARVTFLDDYYCSPYLMAAAQVGTYLSSGASIWNGQEVEWGDNNTQFLQCSLVAGVGMNANIPAGDYEFRLRLEVCYNLGLNNLNKMTKMGSINDFSRKLKGLEATIGVSFPLFINPSYSWMM